MHLLEKLFLFLSLLVFNPMRPLLLSSSVETKLFDLNSLPHNYLTFEGDSHLQYGVNSMYTIALTKDGMPINAPRSTGMAIYSRPVLFLDPHSKKLPSFSTMFAFSIKNIYDEEDPGDGLAFLILPDDDFHGSPGYLGLVDSTGLPKNKFIAIEFDTKCDLLFQDPDDNHLGLDINSLFSVQLATSSSLGVNLNSGDLIHSWIDYKSDEERLEVFLSDSNLKPVKPSLKVGINLSGYLKENMFVGFSAAAEGNGQWTRIEQWEFTIVDSSPPPRSPSLESGKTFPNESGHRHSHLSRLTIGLIIGMCSVLFVVGFGWFCWKKFMAMIQKLEGTNNLEMQTIRSSGGTSEIGLSIPDTNPGEVARALIIEKVLDSEAVLIRVKIVKFCIPSATVCQ